MNGILSHTHFEDYYRRLLVVLESGDLEELKVFLESDSIAQIDDSLAPIFRALIDGHEVHARDLAAQAADMIRKLYPKLAAG